MDGTRFVNVLQIICGLYVYGFSGTQTLGQSEYSHV